MKIPENKSLKVEAPIILQDKLMSTGPNAGSSKISQSYTGYLVSSTNRLNFRISIDPSIAAFTNEINDAISIWNGVPESGISFSIVSSGTFDIVIVNQAINGYGLARIPLNGNAGNLVRINTQNIINDGLNPNQMSTVIAHELGHSIGFRHTDWEGVESFSGTDDVGKPGDALDVPNAAGTDVGSIMNMGANNILPNGLSTKDILALVNLYPLGTPKINGTGILRANKTYTFTTTYVWPNSVIDWSINGKPASISFANGQGTGTLTVNVNNNVGEYSEDLELLAKMTSNNRNYIILSKYIILQGSKCK
ncbi:M57 family metalloprotease [Pedobacter sp. Leaf170]|uniref:M57 family metalloprotease n=1 Tax=Pedobacter sp. Leaf170 TaxID=2876558 RepID=UPI001E659B35|nr:M57 family metalloprotease [Pedobacter sp. Leaf170]